MVRAADAAVDSVRVDGCGVVVVAWADLHAVGACGTVASWEKHRGSWLDENCSTPTNWAPRSASLQAV
ncbi:hypothetical protein K7C20_35825 [Streptomyces decoyicus]|uniref:hypothetical protein n=1 Tax=Streptomyces decoyicus TaxID=249567 RepID=UPI001CA3A1D1|nr:hypothetical protein [Streptomyces decoyicus]QZY19934.1 hypothetical protein K7C20_35825 [Streptomyces decoyicus]